MGVLASESSQFSCFSPAHSSVVSLRHSTSHHGEVVLQTLEHYILRREIPANRVTQMSWLALRKSLKTGGWGESH